MRTLIAVALALPASALAQTRTDLEYRETEVDEQDEALSVRGSFESQYFEYNNIDFRALDETSDQAILDSDDRGAFAFTGAQLELGYQIDPQLRFVINGSHRGLWGDDQIGETNQFGGFIYFPALYIDANTAPDAGVRFRIGRQFFSLGGLGDGVRDYVMADVLDMIRIDVPLGNAATWTLIPLNVFSTAADYNEVDFVGLIGQQSPETFYFRGENLTRRFGTTLTLSEDLATPLGAQAHLFYTDFHGRGTGSDISYQGVLGNFVDNDYVINYGLRGHAELGPATPFVEFNGSAGIDRKELVANDVDANGFAWGAGVRFDTTNESRAGLTAQLRYFEALGPAYGENGLQYSHGYVGLKAQQFGGTLFNRFMGLHPTAYTSRNGISDTPQEIDLGEKQRTVEAFEMYELEAGFHAMAGVWLAQNTGISFVDFSDLDNIQPPFGYSRSEFAATRRLGQSLGTELDLDLGWRFGEHLDAYVNGAILSPGGFYAIEIDRVAGSALGSSTPRRPWAIHTGMRVYF